MISCWLSRQITKWLIVIVIRDGKSQYTARAGINELHIILEDYQDGKYPVFSIYHVHMLLFHGNVYRMKTVC